MPSIDESVAEIEQLREAFEAVTPEVLRLKEASERTLSESLAEIAALGGDLESPQAMRSLLKSTKATVDFQAAQIDFLVAYRAWLEKCLEVARRSMTDLAEQMASLRGAEISAVDLAGSAL